MKEADVVLPREGSSGRRWRPRRCSRCRSNAAHKVEDRKTVRGDAADGFDDLRAQTHASVAATDIANIVLDGADALLLGLETMEGLFPLSCLQTTLAIARGGPGVRLRVEVPAADAADQRQVGGCDGQRAVGREGRGGKARRSSSSGGAGGETGALRTQRQPAKGSARRRAVQTAFPVDASLIVVFSHTGETTRLVAKYHPQCPVPSLSIPVVHGGTVKWTVEGDARRGSSWCIVGSLPRSAPPPT